MIFLAGLDFKIFCSKLLEIRSKFPWPSAKLYDIIYKAVYNNYRVHMDQVMKEMNYIPEGEAMDMKYAANIFFGNYMEPDADPKIYDLVRDFCCAKIHLHALEEEISAPFWGDTKS